MDISLKLKRAVAIVSTFALVLVNAPFAFAQTFSDVATDAWFYQYVEDGVDQGIFDVSDSFRPGDALNRAELTKIVVTAIDGLAGYEAPATPTFDDVAPDAWFYDYVEAAVQLDIVSGYTDASGNLTGLFGPSDTVNRAAATKILVNAFGIPTDLDPASSFGDVSTGAWYHDFVVTAYNQSVLDGYDNGNFGPADPVTRAQVAKLVQTAQNPVERQVASTEPTPPPTSSEGDLEVSLNDNTPASSTVPFKASSVDLLSVDLTAADDDVNITNIVVTRGGVGDANDWENIYVYDGANRLTTGRTINSDTNQATFPVTLTVDAGTTKTIRLVGEVSGDESNNEGSANSNNQHFFYIASAADLSSNAQATAGDFPVTGNTFSIGAVNVNSITVNKGTSISQPTVGGSDQELSAFKLQAGGTNDVAVQQVTVTQNGSLSSSKMLNLKLLRGSDVVATADGFVGDIATFVLDTPYIIPEGQSKNFYVRGDIDGGRTTDTVQIYLDELTDIVAIDQQYGFGAAIVNSDFDSTNVPVTTLQGGKITITDNGPASTQIAQNSTNIELLNWTIVADRDVRVKDSDLTLTLSGDGGAGPKTDVTGSATAVLQTEAAATATLTVDTQANLADNEYFILHEANVAPAAATAVCFYFDKSGTLVDDTGTAAQCQAANGVAGGIEVDISGAGTAASVAALLDTAIDGVGAALDITSTDNTDGTLTLTQDTTGYTGNIAISAAYLAEAAGGASALTAFTSGASAATVANVCVADGDQGNFNDGDTISIPTASGTVYTIVTNVGANGSCSAGNAALTTNETATTAVTAGTIQEVNPYTLIKNVKVVDLDSGSTLQGPMTLASDGTRVAGTTDGITKQFTEDYNLTGGDARHLSVQADLDQNMPDGYTLAAKIDYKKAAGYIKDDAANESIALADIVGGTLTGKSHTTANNSLTVATASVPVSNTYVKGDDSIDALGVSLSAGDAGPITIKKLEVLAYADDDGTFDTAGEGDLAANTLVSSIAIYDGNDIVAGPEALSQVTGESYYKATFDNLNYIVNAGATNTLVAKVDLLNTATGTNWLALDVDSSTITAEDSEANSITPQGGNLNKATTPDPLITVAPSGSLSAYAEGSPQSGVLLTGSTEQLVGKYRFNALREAFQVNKLTVINDTAGDFGTATNTSAVSKVSIRYTDINGVQQTKTSGFDTGGTATFAALDFYIPKDSDAYVEILADINSRSAAGEGISGQTLRLGIQQTGNTVSTFEAIGQSSSTTDNAGTFSNATDVKTMVVRKTKPTFSIPSLGANLTGADSIIYGLTVAADSNGSVGLARLTFTVTENITGSLQDFKFYEGSTPLDVETNIYDAGAVADVESPAGVTLGATTAPVIVSFNREETIDAGTSKTYYLKASPSGSPAVNETVNVSLATGDENSSLAGHTGATNANTAKIFAAAATNGIFTAQADFRSVVNSDGTATPPANIIWSDKSADNHSYPTFAANDGLPTTDTGTYDWTNGYVLKVTALPAVTVTQ